MQRAMSQKAMSQRIRMYATFSCSDCRRAKWFLSDAAWPDGLRQPHVSVVQSLGIVAGCRSHPRSGGRRTALKSRRFAIMAREAAS